MDVVEEVVAMPRLARVRGVGWGGTVEEEREAEMRRLLRTRTGVIMGVEFVRCWSLRENDGG